MKKIRLLFYYLTVLAVIIYIAGLLIIGFDAQFFHIFKL